MIEKTSLAANSEAPSPHEAHEASSELSQRPAATADQETSPPVDTPGNTQPPDRETSHFWLRRSDQLFVGTLVIAAFVLMSVHWIQLSGWGMQPVEIDRQPSRWYEYKIDVNKATWVEWAQLKGIGETLAHRIVEDRAKHGPFRTIDGLQRVKGIGPKTVEKLRPWLTLNPPATQRNVAD